MNKEDKLIRYQQNKLKEYVSKSFETTSARKLEQIFNDEDPRALNKAALYFLSFNKNVKKHIAPKISERVDEMKNELERIGVIDILPISDSKLRVIKNNIDDKEMIKVINNMNSIFSNKKNKEKSKEIIRLKLEKLLLEQGFSYKSISEIIFKNKIDASNLHKFISKKDYGKVSLETLSQARGEIRKWI